MEVGGDGVGASGEVDETAFFLMVTGKGEAVGLICTGGVAGESVGFAKPQARGGAGERRGAGAGSGGKLAWICSRFFGLLLLEAAEGGAGLGEGRAEGTLVAG